MRTPRHSAASTPSSKTFRGTCSNKAWAGFVNPSKKELSEAKSKQAFELELFTIFDRFGKAGAIFASNTSSLSITDFTDITVSRDRCIGMRFFNAVPKMKVIELAQTPDTSDETVAACREVARRMRKEVVVINEAPGFIREKAAAKSA